MYIDVCTLIDIHQFTIYEVHTYFPIFIYAYKVGEPPKQPPTLTAIANRRRQGYAGQEALADTASL